MHGFYTVIIRPPRLKDFFLNKKMLRQTHHENLKIKEIDFINAWNAMLLEISLEKLEFIAR